MDSKEALIEDICEWLLNQNDNQLGIHEELFEDIIDYKLDKKETCKASDEQLEKVSQWMEDKQDYFEDFLGGDNDIDYDLAMEIYEDAVDRV